MPIIEVERLAKTFRTRERSAGLTSSLRSFVAPHYREREAVKHISFTLEPGEILAFIGPNGAGKSTTIKMLTANGATFWWMSSISRTICVHRRVS